MKDLQIFNNNEFGEIQIIEENGKYEFEATGMAKILKYANPHDAISRHCRWVVKREVPHPQSKNKTIEKNFISEGDLYRLITHSELPEAEKFERWVFDEVLPTLRKEGSYSIKKRSKPIDRAIRQHFNIAETIIQKTGIKSGLAYAVAISEAEKETGYSYDEYKKLLPSAEHDIGSFNPTQIGEKLGGIKAQQVNKMLEKLGLQVRKGKNWRLTEQGKEYGEEKPFTRFGHSDYKISWHEKVLDYLTKFDNIAV